MRPLRCWGYCAYVGLVIVLLVKALSARICRMYLCIYRAYLVSSITTGFPYDPGASMQHSGHQRHLHKFGKLNGKGSNGCSCVAYTTWAGGSREDVKGRDKLREESVDL